jgi:hypothetical protein
MVCDSHQAEDVTQGVFVALAQNARQLTHHPVLSGWLHRATQNLAANAVPRVLLPPTSWTGARFWSAPAERSGDGALDFRRAAALRPGSGVARAPNPKRRGASLPAALQNGRGLPQELAPFCSWLEGCAKHIRRRTEQAGRLCYPSDVTASSVQGVGRRG